ncbi:hypothetical protein [Acinetobacter sp. P8-3-8]|uniref:hypothetical protein n=1 Tax=Acinetobacter sp. P8-3-8 TaxID=1029823 RepID=UPI0002485B18|nr:hypothetical protein [Acinetobacter sp. P8-3-8]
MEQAIIRYLKRNPVIPQAAGLPGLHSEVLAANEMLNLFPKSILKDIAAATYRIKGDKTSQGNPFAACQNCCNILINVIILTGSSVGNLPTCSF